MDGLIIKKERCNNIFAGKKIEVRSSNTQKRGRFAIIQSGSGKIVGDAFLTHTVKIRDEEHFKILRHMHHIPGRMEDLKYKNVWGWNLVSVYRYEKPIPYTHPQGAVIWVKNVL